MASSDWQGGGGLSSGGVGFNSNQPADNRTFGYNDNERDLPVLIKRNTIHTPAHSFQGPVAQVGDPDVKLAFWDVMNRFESLDPRDSGNLKQIISTQKKLYAGGFFRGILDKKQQPHWGMIDEDTMNAYAKAVRQTARSNGALTLDETLDASAATNPDDLEEARPKVQRKYTNPEDLKALVQSVAPQVLGQRAGDDFLNKFVNNFRAQEDAAYDQQDNGDSITEPVSVDSNNVEEALRKELPQTTAAFQSFNNIGSFLKLMDSQGLFSAYHQ